MLPSTFIYRGGVHHVAVHHPRLRGGDAGLAAMEAFRSGRSFRGGSSWKRTRDYIQTQPWKNFPIDQMNESNFVDTPKSVSIHALLQYAVQISCA